MWAIIAASCSISSWYLRRWDNRTGPFPAVAWSSRDPVAGICWSISRSTNNGQRTKFNVAARRGRHRQNRRSRGLDSRYTNDCCKAACRWATWLRIYEKDYGLDQILLLRTSSIPSSPILLLLHNMSSILRVACALALSLTAVTASTHNVDKVLESRQFGSGNSFHISNSYVGCGLPGYETCSFEITIDSQETFDLPGVFAHCFFHVPILDSTYHQCDLTGDTSSIIPGRQVQGVYAAASLDPSGRQTSFVYIAVQFTNPKYVPLRAQNASCTDECSNFGRLETWIGVQQGDYDLFSSGLSDYSIIPLQS